MFTKYNLETGMVVEMRNGYRHVVMLPNNDLELGIFMGYSGYMPIAKYTDELMLNRNSIYNDYDCRQESEFDIVKVWKGKNDYNLMSYSNLMSMTAKDEDCWIDRFCDLVFDRNSDTTNTKEEVEEMTMAEICKALGKNVKIVKEK